MKLQALTRQINQGDAQLEALGIPQKHDSAACSFSDFYMRARDIESIMPDLENDEGECMIVNLYEKDTVLVCKFDQKIIDKIFAED